MPRTLQSKKLRYVLWQHADGKCQICGQPLDPENWHADHIVPWRIKPDTNVHDMQALCPKCNLTKGGKMSLRKHQAEIEECAKKMRGGAGKTVLAHVVPGGGKSWLPMLMLRRLPPGTKIGWFVPRDNLRTQAALDAKGKFDLVLNDCTKPLDPSRETDGFVSTHQSLSTHPELWRDEFRRRPYLLVIDELHHACISRSGEPNNLSRAISGLQYAYLLSMTGTLERNGSEYIHGIQYRAGDGGQVPDGEASADYFVRYTREDALAEQAIVPIEFHHGDGPVKWYDGVTNKETEWEHLSSIKGDDESKGLFTALNTEYARQLWQACVDHWKTHGDKLLIVCHSQQQARQYHKQMKSEPSVHLAISDDADASNNIRAFRAATGRSILVTCQIAYEGLDVPPISHICSLTQIRSMPWIYQMLGRAWRATPNKTRAYCFCPDDQRMNRVLARIKSEDEKLIRESQREGGGGSTGPKPEVLPLSGAVGDIRRSALDGVPVSVGQQKFAALVKELGMSLDDPELKAAWFKLGLEVTVPTPNETFNDERARLSKELWNKCCQTDNERGWDAGTSQKLVFQKMGYKRVETMTPNELKAAFSVATRI